MNLPVPAESTESTPTGARRSWRHGTLVYTSAGLVGLLCSLLLGDVAWSLRDRSVPNVMQALFAQFGASNLVSGFLISSLPYLLVLLIGPVVSFYSDRHRGPRGRRIPFLMAHIPVAVLAVFTVASSTWAGNAMSGFLGNRSPGASTCVLMVAASGWCIFELSTVVANAVFYGLINDVVPAQFFGRFYGVFRGISLIAGILFNLFVFKHVEHHFPLVFIGIGVVYGVCFTIMCLSVKEGEYPPPVESGDAGPFAAMRSYFRCCFALPYYRWVFAAIAAPWIAFIGVNHFSVYYARSLSMSGDQYGKCLALTYAFSLLLSYPLGMLADRFHPLRVATVTLALYAFAVLGGAIFAISPASFAFFFVTHGVLSGAWMTSSASLPLRLFPQSKFSQFYAAVFMFIALGIMIAGPLVGQTLELTHRFYRLCFAFSSAVSFLGLGLAFAVYRKFLKYGGFANYAPPEQN